MRRAVRGTKALMPSKTSNGNSSVESTNELPIDVFDGQNVGNTMHEVTLPPGGLHTAAEDHSGKWQWSSPAACCS